MEEKKQFITFYEKVHFESIPLGQYTVASSVVWDTEDMSKGTAMFVNKTYRVYWQFNKVFMLESEYTRYKEES